MNLPNLTENGVPVLGTFVFGADAFLAVFFLDFIGPVVLFYALWNRKPWGVTWASFYIGLFAFNGVVALVTVVDQLGFTQILAPIITSLLFISVIYWKRPYLAGSS